MDEAGARNELRASAEASLKLGRGLNRSTSTATRQATTRTGSVNRSENMNKSYSDPESLSCDNDGLAPSPLAVGDKPQLRSKAADALLRTLGDAPYTTYMLVPRPKPWYLQADYEEGKDIITGPDGKVRRGTILGLVKRLTSHEFVNTTFTKTFLLTFRSFTDLNTLLTLLIERFWISPPEGLTDEEAEEWKKLKQNVIRTRVLSTLRTIVLDDNMLEAKDIYVPVERLAEFVKNEEVKDMVRGKQLSDQITLIRNGDNTRRQITISYGPQPNPIVPCSNKKSNLLDYDPTEVARQLAVIEYTLFAKIKASEWLMRTRDQGTSADISAMIQMSNKIIHWVADAVLDGEDERKRAVVVQHFIEIADRCLDMNNLSSMMAIVSGLDSLPVRRLQRTWGKINPKFASKLRACVQTTDSWMDFSNCRRLLPHIMPPCVPFIGMYLTALTLIREGTPDTISGNLVNFRKRTRVFQVIEEVQIWQKIPYDFARVAVIADYLHEHLNGASDVGNMLWSRSLEREPRESQDEKIVRSWRATGW